MVGKGDEICGRGVVMQADVDLRNMQPLVQARRILLDAEAEIDQIRDFTTAAYPFEDGGSS